MNFEDIKEQIVTSAKQFWEKFQESSTYHQLKDNFENLNPNQQKLVFIGTLLVSFFVVLWYPVDSLFVSNESLTEYSEKRETIRNLFKTQRELSEMGNLPSSLPADSFKSQVESKFQEMRLIPSQIKSVEVSAPNSQLIAPQFSEGGLNVTLNQLNIRQVVEVGSFLQSLSPTLKMVDLLMNTFPQDERYYNVTYRLVALKIPKYEPPAPEPERPSKGKNKKSEDNEG